MIAHCGFNVHLSDDWRHSASFHMSIGHLYILLGDMFIQVLCQFLMGLFVLLVLSNMSSLYILEIKPLLMYHWQLYSPIQSVPFHFGDGFFSHEEAF